MNTLITVNITVISPILEYACQVWHFNLQNYLCEDIERIQKRALKIILIHLSTYNEALNTMGIGIFKDRREGLCDHFFLNNKNNVKLTEFFPELVSSEYDLRSTGKYNN
jgi:hypothetical protein